MNDSTDPNVVASSSGALSAYLSPVLEKRSIVLDSSQLAALGRQERLYDEFAAFVRARRSLLRRWFNPPIPPRGIYLWGGVGRGKSFLMDAFYAAVPLRRKTRVHFHAFMKGVHDELRTLTHAVDPLDSVAGRIARRHRLVCFDEFHVSDVADAMILGRLLGALFKSGVVFVMTSNYHPDDLYPNGLQRQNLLPTIALLKEWLDVIEIDGGTDYRLRELEHLSCYYVAPAGAADAELAGTIGKQAILYRRREEKPKIRLPSSK